MEDNKFLTVKEIARQALPVLMDNLVMPMLCTRSFDEDLQSYKKGDTIQVRKPEVKEAKEFISTIDPQSISETSVDVKLDKIADVSYEVTSKEMTMNISSFEDQITAPAMKGLAEKINRDGLALYKDIPYHCGTAGTTPDELKDVKNARVALNKMKAPAADRSCVWNPDADGELSILPQVLGSKADGQSTAALQESVMGRVLGFNHYMSQAVCEHKAGGFTAATAPKLSVAAVKGVDTVSITATTGAGKLVKGDLLKIGAFDYVLTEDTLDAVSNAISAIKLYPALQADAKVNEIVTFTGDHVANLAFNKAAFGFVTVPMELPKGGADCYVATDPESGLSVRVTFGYDMDTKKQKISFDVLYGYKTLYQQLATRVLG